MIQSNHILRDRTVFHPRGGLITEPFDNHKVSSAIRSMKVAR